MWTWESPRLEDSGGGWERGLRGWDRANARPTRTDENGV